VLRMGVYEARPRRLEIVHRNRASAKRRRPTGRVAVARQAATDQVTDQMLSAATMAVPMMTAAIARRDVPEGVSEN